MWRFLASTTARQVADLLDRDPEGWVDSSSSLADHRYSITYYRDGIKLWVANDYYGLTVSRDGSQFGDVTYLSTFGLSPDHHVIWSAYKRWRQTHPWRGDVKPTVRDHVAAAHASLTRAK